MRKIIVEICCGSADDVIMAKQAGADRVELNSSMFLGGITPSIGELVIAKRTGLPVIAMVRPREGGFFYTETEFETMLIDAEVLVKAGADGIVFGFLHDDGTVDVERCGKMMEIIGDSVSVFHRAIDVVPDWRAALDELIKLKITRVLTSGQMPSVHYGAETVRQMIEYAEGRIEILPGAGIKLENAEEIIKRTGANQIHASLSKTSFDNSTAANPAIHFGGALYPPENIFNTADVDKIRELVDMVNS